MSPRPVLHKLLNHILNINLRRADRYLWKNSLSNAMKWNEKDLFLLPPPVNACLEISVGHLSKITALTSCHKRHSSYSEPSINVQFSDKSRISISTGRKVTAGRGAEGTWRLWLRCSLDINAFALYWHVTTDFWSMQKRSKSIDWNVAVKVFRSPKRCDLGVFKVKATVFYGTFRCLMPQ